MKKQVDEGVKRGCNREMHGKVMEFQNITKGRGIWKRMQKVGYFVTLDGNFSSAVERTYIFFLNKVCVFERALIKLQQYVVSLN